MEKVQNLTEAFKASIKSGVVSGTLKFSNLYCSQLQVFEVASDWANEKGLIYAGVRTDGDSFVALDFRFDENAETGKQKPKSFLYDYLKPMFEEKLGGDYMQAWSISRESIIVK
jgi:hypothetical protein